MDLTRQLAYLLVMRTEMIVTVKFEKFDTVAIVLSVRAETRQMRVQL